MSPIFQKLLKTFLIFVVLCTPTAILTSHMIGDAFHTLAAIYAFHKLEQPKLSQQNLSFENIRIRTQKFFSNKYSIEIHNDDIIHASLITSDKKIYPFQPYGCMKNQIIAYIPIQVRYPFYGVKTYEWCLIIRHSVDT